MVQQQQAAQTAQTNTIGGVPKWLVILGVASLLFAAIWYFFIRKPDFSKVSKVEDEDGDGKPDNFNPGPFTDKLKADIVGLAYGGHNTDLHREILAMSDGRLAAIAADWDRRYKGTGGGWFTDAIESLPKTIEGEYGYEMIALKPLYKARFTKLNLV